MATLDFSELKKVGHIVKYNNEPHQIIWSNFMRTAQRKPVIQTKLRNLISGKVVEYSFKYGEKVEAADVARKKVQFLYADDEGAHFMDQENFETITVPKSLAEDQLGYLKEGMETTIITYEGRSIGLDLPIKIDLKVIEAPPGIKGDSASGTTKPVKLETGLTVNVPLFIKAGDSIRVDTRSGTYVERSN
ncbi:MAG: elongation factor P [Candidatus Doudnabacteria bacterium]|nr:elongation factor P [Candidatus Doudnabacteria bacterium]